MNATGARLAVAHNPSGNYRFLALEGRPFSAGAVADEGYDLAHVRFERPLALEAGLVEARRHVIESGRPALSIAGIELRIPAPLSQADFDTFNLAYVSRLKALGLEVDSLMPATRTNVSPAAGGVSEPSVYAFTYSVAGHRDRPAFVLSGAPETEPGDTPSVLDSIMGVLSQRLEELDASWADATAIQLYGVDDFQQHVVDRVLNRVGSQAVHGIQWFPSLPPVSGLKLEIDARSVGMELLQRS